MIRYWIAIMLFTGLPAQAVTFCPREGFCLILENSSKPASLGECAAARPDLGKPLWTISKQNRSDEPWYQRTCYWRKK